MLEKEVEDHFIWTVEMMGGAAYKFQSPSNRGVADRVVCLPDGSTWFVELKRPKGGRVSPHQKMFAERMVLLRQNYAVLWTIQQVKEWGDACSSSL